MNEYLAFRKMITPAIIQILFWIGVVICVISGIAGIAAGASADIGGGKMVFTGFLTLILGPIFVRVYCELIIVMFRILDVLKDIQSGKKAETASPASPSPSASE